MGLGAGADGRRESRVAGEEGRLSDGGHPTDEWRRRLSVPDAASTRALCLLPINYHYDGPWPRAAPRAAPGAAIGAASV